MHIAVALLRVSEGLDFSAVMEDVEEYRRTILPTLRGNQSFSQLSQGKGNILILNVYVSFSILKNIKVTQK